MSSQRQHRSCLLPATLLPSAALPPAQRSCLPSAVHMYGSFRGWMAAKSRSTAVLYSSKTCAPGAWLHWLRPAVFHQSGAKTEITLHGRFTEQLYASRGLSFTTGQLSTVARCAGLSKILLILGRLRRFLPGPKLDSVQITSRALF
jgi:hypothetical protein